jgi:hypothetical protein
MSMICPWCDTEIIWDEEIGPEEVCPHCLIELTDYRKLDIELGRGGSEEFDTDLDDEDEFDPDSELEDEWEHEEDPEASAAVMAYEEAIDRQLGAQDEQLECFHCQEPMIAAGHRHVGEGFESIAIAGTGTPIMPGPFRVKLFVCPACFRTEQLLDDEERAAWMERLSQNQ